MGANLWVLVRLGGAIAVTGCGILSSDEPSNSSGQTAVDAASSSPDGSTAANDGGRTTPDGATASCPARTAPGIDPLQKLEGGANHYTPRAAAIDTKGRALVGGWSNPTGLATPSLFVARFTTTGAPDASFGNGGVIRFDSEDETRNIPDGFRLVSDDRDGAVIFYTRSVKDTPSGVHKESALVRVDQTGKLDESFGNFGRVRGIRDASEQSVYRLAMVTYKGAYYTFRIVDKGAVFPIPSSEIVLRGSRWDGRGQLESTYSFQAPSQSSNQLDVSASPNGFYLSDRENIWRFGATGALDTSFGTGGALRSSSTLLLALRNGGYAAQFSPDIVMLMSPTGANIGNASPKGTVVAAAELCSGQLVFALSDKLKTISGLSLNANGSTETTRGTNGMTSNAFPDSALSGSLAVAVDPISGAVSAFEPDRQTGLHHVRIRP